MREKTTRDNRALIEFWDKAFSQSEEEARRLFRLRRRED